MKETIPVNLIRQKSCTTILDSFLVCLECADGVCKRDSCRRRHRRLRRRRRRQRRRQLAVKPTLQREPLALHFEALTIQLPSHTH